MSKGWSRKAVGEPPRCHPERRYHALGLCESCYKKAQHQKGFEGYRDRRYQAEYGISLEDYNKMLLQCASRCEICGEPHKEEKWQRLVVDHNHETGDVRGLLCDDCNQVVGRSKENITVLLNTIRYLESHKGTMVTP